MKGFIFFIVLVSMTLISCAQKNTTPEFVKSMTLVWSDEFDGESDEPNPENWDYNTGAHGWGNSELQNYTKDRENSFVKNGVLTIKAKKNRRQVDECALAFAFKKSVHLRLHRIPRESSGRKRLLARALDDARQIRIRSMAQKRRNRRDGIFGECLGRKNLRHASLSRGLRRKSDSQRIHRFEKRGEKVAHLRRSLDGR